MPVSRTINDDLPWSTWPAVATTRWVADEGAATSPASATSVLVVEVVALEGVPGRAGQVGHLLVGHRTQVEQHVVALDAAEHARAAGPQASREGGRVGHREAHAP